MADTRIHGTTRQQVGKQFAEVERAALAAAADRAVPVVPRGPTHGPSRRPCRGRSGPITRCRRSISPAGSGSAGTRRLVRIFNNRMEQIAVHVRQEPGRFSTRAMHIAAEKISGVERGAAWLLARVRRIGPQSARWAEAVRRSARHRGGARAARPVEPGRAAIPPPRSSGPATIASSYGAYHLRTVRALIDAGCPDAGNDVVHERASDHPPAVRLRPVRPRRIPTEGESVHERCAYVMP